MMRFRIADRLVTIAAVLIVAGSGHALFQALSAEPWLRLAFRLETAVQPLKLPDDVLVGLGESMSAQTPDDCNWDMPRSRVTVALDLLRRAAQSGEEEMAARNAKTAVRNGLLCNPADGNLWYLSALLEYRSSSDWVKVEPILLTSVLLTPFERDPLVNRARFVSIALERPDLSLDLDIENDLRRAIAESKPDLTATIVAGLRKAGRGELVDALTADLSESHRRVLANGGVRQPSTFGRTVRYRSFEFQPFGEKRP